MADNVIAVATKIDWSVLSGVTLDGGYELKEIAEERDQAAKVRVRILGSGGKTATAYFMHLEPAEAADQLDIWQTLLQAPHPNLNRPAAVGHWMVAGSDAIYMVLPDADEKLAAVIPERPLEWEEAAEVLHSCEKGLAHLHAHGLLHGSVSPQTVEAVGYSVQLNTESVYRIGKTPRIRWNRAQYLAPESKNLNLTTAADVWCLGATLFEVLTQEPHGTAGAKLENGIPLAAVIYRCLDKSPLTRCTLKDASATAVQSPAPAPVEETQPIPPAIPASPVQAEPVRPVSRTTPALPPRSPLPVNGSAAPPIESRIPPRGQPGPATTRTPSASRLPNPLTPKEAPKQITKDDMALVPIGKRHKRVQRQPVGAKIRTLDGPEQDPAYGEFESTALGPAVSARITALGQQSNLIRNGLAVVGLAAMLVAAVWFIVIPKLQSIDAPLSSNVVVQIPNDTPLKTDSTPNVPLAPPPPLGSPSNEKGELVKGAANNGATDRIVPPPSSPETNPPPVKRYFRVILATFGSRQEAKSAMDAIAQNHPELIMQVAHMKTEDSGADLKYALAVGGVLNISDAQPLLERLHAKGLKTAHLERIVR